MNYTEHIRDYNLDLLDITFSDRIDKLIEEKRFADADAIVEEVIITKGEDPSFYDTIFMADLTSYNDEDLSQLRFHVTD